MVAVALQVLPLPDAPKSFRLSERSRRRLRQISQRLGVSETAALEEAITHYLGTLVRDQRVWRTVPSEPQVGPEQEDE